MNKITVSPKIRSILKPLKNIDYYFVGGFVRDIIMKRKHQDIDIVIFNTDINTINKLLKSRPFIINDRFNTARYIIDNVNIDINISNKDIHYDLLKRDFTINALYANKKGILFDPCGGINDIKKRKIKIVSKSSFIDDPVRIIRAYRFRENFNFKFAKGIKKEITNNVYLINNVKEERINNELQLLFAYKNRGHLFREFLKNNMLLTLFPQLNKTINFYHKKYKTKKLIYHLLYTVEAIDTVINSIKNKGLLKYAQNNMFVLYLSALLHDIEKPICIKRTGNKLSFIGHDKKSSEIAYHLLRDRLKLSKKQLNGIRTIIAMHMRPHLLLKVDNITHKGYFRLMRDANEHLEGLIILSMADRLSSDGIIENNFVKLYTHIQRLKERINKKKLNLISGNDIMNYFNIPPGPIIGKMIEIGNEYAIEHNIKDKTIILNYIKKHFYKDLM